MKEHSIPEALKSTPHWIVWREELRDDKLTKVPYVPGTNRRARSTDPSTWSPFDDAITAYRAGGWGGVGFVFTGTPYAGVDLDHCLDEKGELNGPAADIVKALDSYTEISPGGAGLHIIVKAELPPGRRRTGNVEMYDTGRFFTITGNRWKGSPATVEERTSQLRFVHAALFPQEEPQNAPTSPPQPVHLDDRELIERAMQAKGGDRFRKLWDGDWSDYPSQSEADLALCGWLAFWTGGDRERIDGLFRQSGLCRDKWLNRADYRGSTMEKALSGRSEFYDPQRRQGKKSQPSDALQEAAPGNETAVQPIHLTDLGNARRLVGRHGRDLHYCHPWGKWFVWDGTRWAQDDTAEVERRAKETVASIYIEASEAQDEEARKAIAKHAMKSESRFRLEAMIALADSELGIPVVPDQLDADHWLLNCLNGTLDLRKGKLLHHRREDLITKQVPVAYDRAAKSPRWDAFLDRIMAGNQDLIGFLQRAVGYSLTGDTSEQCLFVLYGTGMNGKSTFLEVITAMMGDYGQRTPTETLLIKRFDSIPNDVAALKGARLVTAVESEEGRRLAESRIKAMTGGDRIPARFMRQEWFDFLPSHKLFLGTNHKPIIRGTDLAIWRRIRLIPFSVVIPESEQDKHLPDKLKEELPGILRWAVEGCLKWQQDGLTMPQEVRQATEGYRQDMDPLAGFLTGCCTMEPTAWARAGQLYEGYRQWCEGNGEKPISNRRFGESLIERGFVRDEDRKGRFYLGIGLVEDAHPGESVEGADSRG